MSSVVATLFAQLFGTGERLRCCVAFSGGLDSTVLLHGLQELRQQDDRVELRAVHVHHGLHTEANDWVAHCEAFARRLRVPLEVCRVDVDPATGDGPEAAARRARYAALAALLDVGETLVTAHHAEDQVETVLLRLLRGAGVRGLGSIATRGAFGPGQLVRPLLTVSRAELEAYARAHGLGWIEDPTNRDMAIDRNFLRHAVVPLLRERWPGLEATIGRSARLAREAARMLDEVGRRDSATVVSDGLIELAGLRRLDPARQRNLLRHVLHAKGLVPPTEAQLTAGLQQLLSAREDRNPILQWPGGQVRRYRERLYVLGSDPALAKSRMPHAYRWDGRAPLDLGPVRGRLQLAYADPARHEELDLRVRFRCGGERVLEADHRHHKRLKKMFQAAGVVPWMREHVPLVFCDDVLLAVGDLWASADLAAHLGPTAGIVWDNHGVIR